MNTIIAKPLICVDKIKFGMKRSEVRSILGEATEFKKSKFSKTITDDFGFCHVFYNLNDECEAIEIFEETEVQIENVVVFPNGMDKLKSMLSDLEDDNCGFISKSKSIGVYAPDGKMESILFGCAGYYE